MFHYMSGIQGGGQDTMAWFDNFEIRTVVRVSGPVVKINRYTGICSSFSAIN